MDVIKPNSELEQLLTKEENNEIKDNEVNFSKILPHLLSFLIALTGIIISTSYARSSAEAFKIGAQIGIVSYLIAFVISKIILSIVKKIKTRNDYSQT